MDRLIVINTFTNVLAKYKVRTVITIKFQTENEMQNIINILSYKKMASTR